MRILPEKTQCLLIDMQEKMLSAVSGREECEKRVAALAKGLRILDIPMMITQQYTKGLGMSVTSVYEAAGSEEYFDKKIEGFAGPEAVCAGLESRTSSPVRVKKFPPPASRQSMNSWSLRREACR